MATFKLTRLPLLAQILVLRTMKPKDVFFLSLFFSRFRKLAKSIRWFPAKQPTLQFSPISNTHSCLYLRDPNDPSSLTPLIEYNARVFNSPLRQIDGRKIGISVDVICHDSITPYTIGCPPDHLQLLWDSLLKTAREIFGLSILFDLYVTPRTLGLLPLNLRKLRKLTVEDCKLNWYIRDTVDIRLEGLDIYFYRLYHHGFFPRTVWIRPNSQGSVNIYSCMLRVFTLAIDDARWFNGNHLSIFDGMHLILEKTNLRTFSIFHFLRDWMKTRVGIWSIDQLEVIIIRDGQFNVDEIHQNIQSQPWDPTKRDARYKPMSQLDLPVSENEYDCTGARDIVRGCDEMLASFKVTPNQFHFFVWRNRLPK